MLQEHYHLLHRLHRRLKEEVKKENIIEEKIKKNKILITMSTKHKNNVIMVRRTVPKTVNLPDRSFVCCHRRATRNELPSNLKIGKTSKQRVKTKNKRRRIRGRGLDSFIKILMKKPIVENLEERQ